MCFQTTNIAGCSGDVVGYDGEFFSVYADEWLFTHQQWAVCQRTIGIHMVDLDERCSFQCHSRVVLDHFGLVKVFSLSYELYIIYIIYI